MASREREGAVGQRCGQVRRPLPQAGQIVRLEADDEAVGHDDPRSVAGSIRLHRPFEAALDLDRPDRRPEEPRGLTLEEPFEEAFDGGKGSHVEGGV
jgi:hypothetical protein